eukprot:4543123-Prymnesium_polylepis.1
MTTARSRRACQHRPAHRRRRTHWPHWRQLRFPRRATHRAARSCSFPARTRAPTASRLSCAPVASKPI